MTTTEAYRGVLGPPYSGPATQSPGMPAWAVEDEEGKNWWRLHDYSYIPEFIPIETFAPGTINPYEGGEWKWFDPDDPSQGQAQQMTTSRNGVDGSWRQTDDGTWQFGNYEPIRMGGYGRILGDYELEYDKEGREIERRPRKPKATWIDKAAMLTVGAISGGAALYGLGLLGAGAGGGLGGAGLWEAGTLANGVTVGGPMSMGGAAGTALPSMGAMGGMGAAAGGLGSTGGAAGGLFKGGGGLLGSLGSLGKYAGPISTAIGALSGGKESKNSTTSQSKMDPRMDPYIYGQGGLLAQSQNMLNQQLMLQQSQPGYAQLMQQGGGLMNMPIAGNGYWRQR